MRAKIMKLTLVILMTSILVAMLAENSRANWGKSSVSTDETESPPLNVIFRLLAVENYLEERTKPAEDFVKHLISFENWQNSTVSNGFHYSGYIHLLSRIQPDEIDEKCKAFYMGRATKENLMNEMLTFLLNETFMEDSLSIRILYYSGNAEKVITEGNTSFCLALDEQVFDWELSQTFRDSEQRDASTTILIFDSHYSGGFITELARPGCTILTACSPSETAGASAVSETSWMSWFTGTGSGAYPNGTDFGPLGLIGGVQAAEDSNHDGWRSIGEIFKLASQTTTWYATNQTDPESGGEYVQSPWAHFGIAGGEAPIVQISPNAKFPKWGSILPNIFSSPDPYHYHNEDFQHRMFGYSPSNLRLSGTNGPQSPDLLWTRSLLDPISSSVAVADGMIFVGTVGGIFYALEMTTGEVVWSFSVGCPIYSSPAVQDGIVVFGSAEPGRIYALDQYRGTVRWMYEIPGGESVLSSPTIKDDRVFITSSDGFLRVFDLFEGFIFHELYVGGDVRSSPAIAEGKIFAVGNSVKAFDEEGGTLIWTFHTSWPIFFSSPAVHNGVVYIGTGNDDSVYALDATTGNALWRFKTGGWFSSPAVDPEANMAFAACRNSRVYCLNRDNGYVVWEYVTENPSHRSSPTIANGLVYCACSFDPSIYCASMDNRLYCLNETTGAQVWNYAIEGNITSAPVVIHEHVLVGSDDGYLYCFGPPFPQHDVAIVNGSISKETVKAGDLVQVGCTLKNLGNVHETVIVEWTHNTTAVWLNTEYSEPERLHSETITIQPEEMVTLEWIWNTSGTQNSEHGIILRADLVEDETKADNNAFFPGSLQLRPQTDLDSNGVVDIIDIAIVARSYGTRPGDQRWNPTADFDDNGLINIVDIATVARDFGKTF